MIGQESEVDLLRFSGEASGQIVRRQGFMSIMADLHLL